MNKYIIIIILIVIPNCLSAQFDLYGMWSKRAAYGNTGSANVTSTVTDEEGNVYIAGIFTKEVNLSDDICDPQIISTTQDKGSYYLAKYSKEGKYQWHVVFHPMTENNKNIVFGIRAPTIIYDAITKTISLMSVIRYHIDYFQIPLKVNIVGPQNSKTLQYNKAQDGGTYMSVSFTFVQIINSQTGDLKEAALDSFITASDPSTLESRNGKLYIGHWGSSGSIYSSVSIGGGSHSSYRESLITIYDIATKTETLLKYSNQPQGEHPGYTDGSRIRQYATLANNKNIFIHMVQDYSNLPTSGVPNYYLMRYNADLTVKEKEYLFITNQTRDGFAPKFSSDENNNIYLAINYGDSKYWNTGAVVPNSNTITNFLGSGKSFRTAPQENKVILAKLDNNFNHAWSLQIGTNSTTSGGDQIYFTDIKSNNNYTYLTGRFKGLVEFNGISLNSPDSYDGFYAVFSNIDGKCKYAVSMTGDKLDNAQTLSLTGTDKMLIAGTFQSISFQSDPSGRLYPLSSAGTTDQVFMTLYTTDPNTPVTPIPKSFGDAPAIYGTAVHDISTCLCIGELDVSKIQVSPMPSTEANTALNDDGIALSKIGRKTNLHTVTFNLDASNELTAKVNVKNTSKLNAKMRAWIDFNQNGVFDPNESSTTGTINALTGSTQVDLIWQNAGKMLRSGQTYLRIRMSSADIADTQATGLLFDGEVEDYMLNFDFALPVNPNIH